MFILKSLIQSLSKVFKEPINELTSLSNEVKSDSMSDYMISII